MILPSYPSIEVSMTTTVPYGKLYKDEASLRMLLNNKQGLLTTAQAAIVTGLSVPCIFLHIREGHLTATGGGLLTGKPYQITVEELHRVYPERVIRFREGRPNAAGIPSIRSYTTSVVSKPTSEDMPTPAVMKANIEPATSGSTITWKQAKQFGMFVSAIDAAGLPVESVHIEGDYISLLFAQA